MNADNPFAQGTSFSTLPKSEVSTHGPKKLRPRVKSVDSTTLAKVDKVSVQAGWATDDEKQNSNRIIRQKMSTVQLGVRVGDPYLEFVKMVCDQKRQTKRVVIEQAIEAYCRENGFDPIETF